MTTTLTEHEIINAYLIASRKRKAAFARDLGISRQRFHLWTSGAFVPDVRWLKETAVRADEAGNMARDLLARRAAEMTVAISK